MMHRTLLLVFCAASMLTQAAFAQPAAVKECETLRHHGDPSAKECFQKLSRSADAATRAEGLWGLKDYNGANDAFQAAVKARPKDANLLTRWGLMYLEHWQPSDASDLFGEALKAEEHNPNALLGMARVMSESFEGKAGNYAEMALKYDPKLYQAYELLARMA